VDVHPSGPFPAPPVQHDGFFRFHLVAKQSLPVGLPRFGQRPLDLMPGAEKLMGGVVHQGPAFGGGLCPFGGGHHPPGGVQAAHIAGAGAIVQGAAVGFGGLVRVLSLGRVQEVFGAGIAHGINL